MFIIKEVTPQDVTSFIVLIQSAHNDYPQIGHYSAYYFINFVH